MQKKMRLLFCLGAILISGCGNWDAVHIDHDFSNNNSATLDIKTRAIISNDLTRKTLIKDSQGLTTQEKIEKLNRICAEPSPDAMTAYAAQLAGEYDVAGQSSVGLAGSYQGSAAFVGMRSQTIQLLRDQLYRLCEANMNGWLTPSHYEMLLSRNQRYTLALMAIENLAQTTQVPVVTLTSNSTAELYANLKDSQEALDKANKEKSDIEKIAESDRSEAQKARLAQLAKEIPILEERMKNSRAAVASGSTSQHVATTSSGTSTASKEAIDAIKDITKIMITQGEDGYKCFDFATQKARGEIKITTGAGQALDNYCTAYFAQRVKTAGSGGTALLQQQVDPVSTQQLEDFIDAIKTLDSDQTRT